MTYTLISLPFLAIALGLTVYRWRTLAAADRRQGTRIARRYLQVVGVVSVIVLVLTAIFDNIMIIAGLVDYGTIQRLGVHIGAVPIEDFFYSLFVTLVVPALFHPGASRSVPSAPTAPLHSPPTTPPKQRKGHRS